MLFMSQAEPFAKKLDLKVVVKSLQRPDRANRRNFFTIEKVNVTANSERIWQKF